MQKNETTSSLHIFNMLLFWNNPRAAPIQLPAVILEPKPTLQKSITTWKDIALESIRDGETVFMAQVVKVNGSEIQVILFITGQNLYAKMTLVPYKKVYFVEPNDIVNVKAASRNKEGRIMQVSFVP